MRASQDLLNFFPWARLDQSLYGASWELGAFVFPK
jgi:hypothetical protein